MQAILNPTAAVSSIPILAAKTLLTSCLSSLVDEPPKSTVASAEAAQRMESKIEQSPESSITLKTISMNGGSQFATVRAKKRVMRARKRVIS